MTPATSLSPAPPQPREANKPSRRAGSFFALIALLLISSGSAALGDRDPPMAARSSADSAQVEPETPLASAAKQRVLVLNSYNIGYAWTDNEVRAIQDVFADNPDVILHVEFMDTKLSNSERHLANLARLMRRQFRGVRFDVVIATDDDALDFMRDYGDQLFPKVPVVFAGINNFTMDKIEGMDNVTGVNEEADFRANLELIAKLKPNVRNIYVIADDLTAGRMILREFDRATEHFVGRFRFHYLTGLSMDEIRAKLRLLQSDSVVFYLTFFQDATGRHFAPEESIPLLSASSPVPMFGQVDYMIGKGVLGGKVKNAYYQGQMAARIAQRILNGEKANCIPIEMDSPNAFMFDYRQLKRFDIGLGALPQGSIILNQPETFFYKYRTLIAIVIGILLVLLGFILVLLFNIRRRKRAQQGLQDILIAMSSVLDLHSTAEIKDKLINIINRIIFLDRRIDRVTIYNYSGKLHEFDQANLTALSTEPPLEGTDVDYTLVRQAIEKGSSLVADNQCVALFRTHGLLGNLVHLSGRRRFEAIDQDLLEILTSNVSMVIEQLEKSKMQEALETARKIQLSMLTRDFDLVSAPFGVDLHAALIPAKEVGGDLYDTFAIDQEHLCVTVGDVADKGVPAALFMAVAKTLIRANAKPGIGPEEILRKVNGELARDNQQCLFVTLFVGIFEPVQGRLRYANAGHNLPYKVDREHRPVLLDGRSGPALGIFDDATFRPFEQQLTRGETLFVYTDGVTEANDIDQQLYGEQRLEHFLGSLPGVSAERINNALIDELHAFSQGAGQADDITVLTMRVTETPA